MLLVVGSTGVLGSEICRRLTSQGREVCGLVRATSNPVRLAALKDWGVNLVPGDLRDPASMAKACRGMDTVIATAHFTPSLRPDDSIPVTDQQAQVDLIMTARQAGTSRFILVSIPFKMEDCLFTIARSAAEMAVMESGMDYTLLSPSVIMEDWLTPALGFDYANAKATIYGDGHAKNHYISLGDVAQYSVECVDNRAVKNQIIELGQSQATSMLEAVRAFEKIAGKSFEPQFVPEAALNAQRAASTVPLKVSFAAFILNMAHGIQVDTALADRLFSFPLASVEDYAQRVLG